MSLVYGCGGYLMLKLLSSPPDAVLGMYEWVALAFRLGFFLSVVWALLSVLRRTGLPGGFGDDMVPEFLGLYARALSQRRADMPVLPRA